MSLKTGFVYKPESTSSLIGREKKLPYFTLLVEFLKNKTFFSLNTKSCNTEGTSSLSDMQTEK